MSDVRQRLARCFEIVFPKLVSAEVSEASAATVAEWDSLAMVTLMTVVQEEFAVRISVDDIEKFQSFESIFQFLESELEQSSGAERDESRP